MKELLNTEPIRAINYVTYYKGVPTTVRRQVGTKMKVNIENSQANIFIHSIKFDDNLFYINVENDLKEVALWKIVSMNYINDVEFEFGSLLLEDLYDEAD